jgi:hypothetical protein
MSSTTFETLPDEIFMIIIRNSGDIFTTFRAFFGLNQRINNILIDKRTHLLTDFLITDSSDVNIDDYYNSNVFHDVSEQLLLLKTTENEQQFRQCLEPLVGFYIRSKYHQSINELELGLTHVQSIRMELNDDELEKIDNELKETFNDLQNGSNLMKNIKRVEYLVRTKGAQLNCSDNVDGDFNFVGLVNKFLSDTADNNPPLSQDLLNSLVRMFKTLIISNISLLHNEGYVGNGGCVIYYFLFHIIYKLQSFNTNKSPPFIRIENYRAAVDLLLFVLQCLYYEQVAESWWINHFSELLKFIPVVKLSIDEEIFVYASQVEILKIIFDENILNSHVYTFDEPVQSYSSCLGNLFISNRIDLISTIFHHNQCVRELFQGCWDDPDFISILTGDQMRRRVFLSVLDDVSIGTWLATTTNLLFILLQKRECRLVKKLFSVSPSLVDRLDSDGNDPLLYVCIQGRGCRQRLVEYLLKIGCDVQRRNSTGQNFQDVLQLSKNRHLLKKLIEQETIEIASDSDEIKIIKPS